MKSLALVIYIYYFCDGNIEYNQNGKGLLIAQGLD